MRMPSIGFGANIDSLRAQSGLKRSTDTLTSTLERLSSGQRINHASDDAAGLSIASQLTARARVFNQAVRNLNDGLSAANIAEGALNSLRDITQRQFELAEQAANGTYSLQQRKSLDAEANKLVDEFNRIVQSTTFNGISLFDTNLGSVVLQAGYGNAGTLSMSFTDSLQRTVGDGTFQIASTTAAANPARLASGDFNGDGKLDFVSIGINNSISISIGNGNGTFSAAQNVAVSVVSMGFNLGVATGDLNGDGKTDIVTANGGAGTFSVLLGNGNGSFSAPLSTHNGLGASASIVLTDLNGDGKLDMLLGTATGMMQVRIGNNDGSFRAATNNALSGIVSHMEIGDFNGDGATDVITSNYAGTLNLLTGSGNGTFQLAATFTVGGTPSDIAVGDFNNDGNLDFISSNYGATNLTLYFGNGNGLFKAAQTFSPGGNPYSIESGDFNGDGLTDFASANYNGELTTYISNGNGTFQGARTSVFSAGIYDFIIGDFDRDSRPDLLAADQGPGAVNLYSANGSYVATTAYLNLKSQSTAREALDSISGTLNRIIGQIGSLGATTSRFASDISNLEVQRENFYAAAGRIIDVDFAEDTAALTRQKILQQAAASVLSQANQAPAVALSLLRG